MTVCISCCRAIACTTLVLVLLQVTRFTKSFITPVTLVPVVACVNGDDVRPHVRLTREPGRVGAAVRPFPVWFRVCTVSSRLVTKRDGHTWHR